MNPGADLPGSGPDAGPDDAGNRAVFDDPAVVASYADITDLTAAEQEMFDRFVPAGSRVLDLGVGTGRTTPRLSAGAAWYLGIDVAPNMVAQAAAAHPDASFAVGDAATLEDVETASVDVVVFSYNGLDYLVPDERRARSIDAIARVLVPGGRFVFSTHDPRALLRPPNPDLGARRWPVAALQTTRRLAQRLPTAAFRSGAGVIHDPAWGGLTTYMATPRRVVDDLTDHGFRHLLTLPAHHPAPPRRFATEWWYHAFER